MFRKPTGAGAALVHLVYAQEGPEAPEPLVALVASEAEAGAIEREVQAVNPGVRVRWESHRVLGGPAATVHALLLDCGADECPEPADPIGVAVHADAGSAAASLRELAATAPGARYLVRRLPVGWRRPEWPFVTTPWPLPSP